MSNPLGLIDRLLLPFYSPPKIAKLLAKKGPADAAAVLKTFPRRRSLDVISHWSERVRAHIINQLGDYGIGLLKKMDTAEQSKLMLALDAKLVRKFTQGISDKELKLLATWDLSYMVVVLPKLPAKKASSLLSSLKHEDQETLINGLKPWVRAELIRAMKPEDKARLLSKLELKSLVDLFGRWGPDEQSEVFRFMATEQRNEILNYMRPPAVIALLKDWDHEKLIELIVSMEETRQMAIFKYLPDELQEVVFPALPKVRQRVILSQTKPSVGARLTGSFSSEEVEELLSGLPLEHASAIRKARIIG